MLWAPAIMAATLQLAWMPGENARNYRLWLSLGTGPFNPILSVQETTASWWYADGETNQQRFYVVSENETGTAPPSNTVTNFPAVLPPPPPPVPDPPSAMHLNWVSGNRADLGWSSHDSTATTRLEQSIDGGPFQTIATIPAGTLHWTVTAKKKTRYEWRARSCNGVGCSEPSGSMIYQW